MNAVLLATALMLTSPPPTTTPPPPPPQLAPAGEIHPVTPIARGVYHRIGRLWYAILGPPIW